MTDAIPFEKQYKAFTDAQRAKANERIDTIKGAEKLTVDTLDVHMPAIVGAIIGGDNVSLANRTLKALRGERKAVAVKFLQRFLPHEFKQDGTFGKKLDKVKSKAKERTFRKWEATGELYRDWGSKNTEVKTKRTIQDTLRTDFKKALLKEGLAFDDVVTILQEVAMEVQAEQEKKAAA